MYNIMSVCPRELKRDIFIGSIFCKFPKNNAHVTFTSLYSILGERTVEYYKFINQNII